MRILFYPEQPQEYTKMYRTIEYVGAKAVSDPEDSHDVAIFWSSHKTVYPHDPILLALSERERVINIGGVNVRKSKVESVMVSVFGYNSILDPYLTKEPRVIYKNNRQTKPQICVVENNGNLMEQKGKLCVRLLNDKVGGAYRTYRCIVSVPNILATIEFYYDENDRFSRLPAYRKEIDPIGWISVDEQLKIISYCRRYGTEFTELDIIRHDDGKIYIIDNNNIPARINPWPGPDKYPDSHYELLSNGLIKLVGQWKQV